MRIPTCVRGLFQRGVFALALLIPQIGSAQFVINPYAFGSTVVPEAASIYNNLVSWWAMDDNAASTTVLDSFASNNMTTVGGFNTSSWYANSPAFLNGWLGIPSSANDVWLARSNTNLDKSGSTDFSFGAWVKVTGYTTFSGGLGSTVMGRLPIVSGSTNYSYGIYLNRDSSTPLWLFAVSSNGTSLTTTSTTAAAAATLSTTWYLVIADYDHTNSQIRVTVNGTTSTPTSWSSTLFAGNANFSTGQGANNGSVVDTSRAMTMQVNEAFFVNKALTSAEKTYLYNAGAGKTWAQFKADAGH